MKYKNEMKFTPQKYFYSLLLLFLLSFIPLLSLHGKPIIGYTYSYLFSSVIFIFISFYIVKNFLSKSEIFALIFLAVILRLAFITLQPIGSDDYYRYIWDGKVETYGINPYRYAPDDSALTYLHSDDLPKYVNYPKMKTIYPPLSQAIFFIAYLSTKEGYLGLKIYQLLFEILTLSGLLLILKKLNLPSKNIFLYLLAPIPIFQLFIDAHVDGFGLSFFLFSIYFYLDKKKLLSYIFLGLSICIKPLGVILIPIYFFDEKILLNRIKSVIIPISICALLYIPFIFSGTPFQALIKFTENWAFNGVVFNILDSFIHDNQKTRIVCSLLLLSTYLPIILSKKNLLDKIYFSVIFLFIFSPIVHPWYLTWLTILLPIVPYRSGIVYIGLISLTVFTVLNFQLSGVWKEYTWILFLEYTPVIIFLFYELISKSMLNSKIDNNY